MTDDDDGGGSGDDSCIYTKTKNTTCLLLSFSIATSFRAEHRPVSFYGLPPSGGVAAGDS